ncbi:MAG: dockerin type I domain-containing protein [candidate division Zixibacteria bacterium]|nr:dockerin type I domain-containing protein [candidate division Zixibacteria bacterium]
MGYLPKNRLLIAAVLAGWCAIGSTGSIFAAPRESIDKTAVEHKLITNNRQLRSIGVHDAGDLYMPFSGPHFGSPYHYPCDGYDPETGESADGIFFPTGSNKIYSFCGALLVGGVVGDDTLVSQAYHEYYGFCEFAPTDSLQGGVLRTCDFADDEFLSMTVDRQAEYVSGVLGIGLTAHSYTWADSLYDNFAIIRYTIRNRNPLPIADGWIGFLVDNDVYLLNPGTSGACDDFSGMLDTLLYDDDLASRVLIPYTIDNDGDPVRGAWDSTSVRGASSIRLLDADFDISRENFNWTTTWCPNYIYFGPRRLGTIEDPLRLFYGTDTFGVPSTDEMQYYLLSHPEIDYDGWEVAIHDSTDGWLPPPEPSADYIYGTDTRLLYSFGSFNLAPGDSLSFTLAVVLADDIHREPTDYAAYFDPQNPSVWRDRLDFGPLMVQHRRVDSVYKSGFTLPIPGPPQGLIITDYEDSYIKLSWWPSRRPDLAGYYLYTRSPVGQWVPALPDLITDTMVVFSVPDPARTYELAVGAVDILGRQSKQSMPVSILPGRPYPVKSLTVAMDGIVPELSWSSHDDTTLQAYFIYRSIWKGPFQLYDSTANLFYRDLQTESGTQYNYKVSAKNRLGLESALTGPVTVIPLARDKGLLFCSLNKPGQPNSGPYQNQYLLALYQSAAAITPIDLYVAGQGHMGLKQMADYSLIIVDWEKREDGPPLGFLDSLRYYLENGGDAVFILLATETINGANKIYRYDSGSFSHDILKLDSAVTNGFHIQNGCFVGDLAGCQPLVPEYPLLVADTVKFRPSLIPITGLIPMAGYLFPTDEVEPLYTYISSRPDSIDHGQINGIRYKGEAYQFVLFTFPLSLMKTPAAYVTLKRALTDMGVDMGCGDISMDDRITVGDAVFLINYLFRGGPAPTVLNHADVDGSGTVDLADAMYMINFLFRAGPGFFCPDD